jgi:exodeoxyribonuclease VII large subunit
VRISRCLTDSRSPVPVVTGIGHEDDTTVADLVADYRAATPTAAMVALLPERQLAQAHLQQLRRHLAHVAWLRLQAERQQLQQRRSQLEQRHPQLLLQQHRQQLKQARALLQALSPRHLLERGFSLVRDSQGQLLRSVQQASSGEAIVVQLADGEVDAKVESIRISAR